MAVVPLASVSPALFEVLESGYKGMGGFAIRDIQVGERILAERPLAKWQSGENEGLAAGALAAVIDALPLAEQQRFFALSQCAQHGSTKSALGIWASNAYPTDGGGESGVCSSVFEQACRLNHDCRPNAHIGWNDRIGMQTVHAVRLIRKGEEVVVAYIGGDADGTREARQRQLQRKFSFVCKCPQCELTGASLERSETRQRRINDIVRRLATKPSDTLALVHERRGLMEQERMPTIWGKSGALLALASMHHMGSAATRKLAWSVATSAHDCCHVALGADAHETIAFASYANHPAFAALQKMKAKKHGRGARAPTAGNNLDQLVVKMEAAKRALAEATATESEAIQREVDARATASAAVGAAAEHELLTLSRDGHRGSVWTFAPGTFDNLKISWTELEWAVAKLADGVRRTLVDDRVDDDLLGYLTQAPYATQWTSTTRAGADSQIVSLKAFVTAAGCSALRGAVDAERDRTTDTVDHFAQHTLGLSIGRLASLIGHEAVERLQALPTAMLSQRSEEASERARAEARMLSDTNDTVGAAPANAARLEAALSAAKAAAMTARLGAAGGFAEQIYLRRYSRETRPWLGFHTDRSAVTINVALAPDATHEGGRLHAVLGGEHRIVERDEGEATVHGDDVMHAVSAMRGGVRYSLVLLFFIKNE